MMKRAFTLLELLVVVAIMGLLGTASVGGYRAMQRGMEERGVLQNVNQFIKTAYERAQIDRVPVAVYFWNETLQEESDTANIVVVGRAVAVRRQGRISKVEGKYLVDEYGDLRFSRLSTDEDSDEEETGADSSSDNGMFLYPMNGSAKDGTQMRRSVIAQSTVKRTYSPPLCLGGSADIEAYAFYLVDEGGVSWQSGDAYGFEFAEIQLPHGFIFGTSYQEDVSNPIQDVKKLNFKVGTNSGSGATGGTDGDTSITIAAIRPDSGGSLSAQSIGTSDNPTNN